MSSKLPIIEPIPLRFVNAYIIRGRRHVLIDTGFPGMADTLLNELKKRDISIQDISLILLTHGHPDHAGSAAELRKRLHVPVAIHTREAEWMRSGQTHLPRPIRPFGYVVKAITKPTIEPFEPDVLLEEGMDLTPYGIEGQIISTPGHSPGSISILHPGGDCIAGDVLAGSLWRNDHPLYPYLAEDVPLLHQSIERLLRSPVERLYFGHGLSSTTQAVRHRFATRLIAFSNA